MQTVHTQYQHCAVIKANGHIDSATAPALGTAFSALTDQGRYHLVFDMSEVEFISSAGLRVLISTQKICKRYNRGELVLANVPANILASLELAGFNVLFKIYDDLLTAVGNF